MSDVLAGRLLEPGGRHQSKKPLRGDVPGGVSDILDWVGLANYKPGNEM